MPYNLLQVFRNKLNDPYLNLNALYALYEFECETLKKRETLFYQNLT